MFSSLLMNFTKLVFNKLKSNLTFAKIRWKNKKRNLKEKKNKGNVLSSQLSIIMVRSMNSLVRLLHYNLSIRSSKLMHSKSKCGCKKNSLNEKNLRNHYERKQILSHPILVEYWRKNLEGLFLNRTWVIVKELIIVVLVAYQLVVVVCHQRDCFPLNWMKDLEKFKQLKEGTIPKTLFNYFMIKQRNLVRECKIQGKVRKDNHKKGLTKL